MQAGRKYIEIALIFFAVLCVSTVQAAGLQGSVSIQTAGSIDYPSPAPANNLILNPDFSEGFAYWGGYTGWTGSSGYAFLDNSTYHNAAPSLALEPDPYGITPGDPACWATGISVNGEVTLKVDVWVKTSVDSVGYGGARMMVDFYDASGNDLTNEGYFQIINCTVPLVDNCPVVAWGTTSWTLIEIYVKATNPNTVTAVPWLQVFPAQSGVTLPCWFDDAYCAVAG
jgi:hypothetical protein